MTSLIQSTNQVAAAPSIPQTPDNQAAPQGIAQAASSIQAAEHAAPQPPVQAAVQEAPGFNQTLRDAHGGAFARDNLNAHILQLIEAHASRLNPQDRAAFREAIKTYPLGHERQGEFVSADAQKLIATLLIEDYLSDTGNHQVVESFLRRTILEPMQANGNAAENFADLVGSLNSLKSFYLSRQHMQDQLRRALHEPGAEPSQAITMVRNVTANLVNRFMEWDSFRASCGALPLSQPAGQAPASRALVPARAPAQLSFQGREFPVALIALAIEFSSDPFHAASIARVCQAFNLAVCGNPLFRRDLARMGFHLDNKGNALAIKTCYTEALRFLHGHLQGEVRLLGRQIVNFRDCRNAIATSPDVLDCFFRCANPLSPFKYHQLTGSQEDQGTGCFTLMNTLIQRGAFASFRNLPAYLRDATPETLSLTLLNLTKHSDEGLPANILMAAWLQATPRESLAVLLKAVEADVARHGTKFEKSPKESILTLLDVRKDQFDLLVHQCQKSVTCGYNSDTILSALQNMDPIVGDMLPGITATTIVRMVDLNQRLSLPLDQVMNVAVRFFDRVYGNNYAGLGQLIDKGVPFTPRILATALAYHQSGDGATGIELFCYLVAEKGIQPTIETLNEIIALGPLSNLEWYIDILLGGNIPGREVTFEPVKPTEETLAILKASTFPEGCLPMQVSDFDGVGRVDRIISVDEQRQKLLEKLAKAMGK